MKIMLDRIRPDNFSIHKVESHTRSIRWNWGNPFASRWGPALIRINLPEINFIRIELKSSDPTEFYMTARIGDDFAPAVFPNINTRSKGAVCSTGLPNGAEFEEFLDWFWISEFVKTSFGHSIGFPNYSIFNVDALVEDPNSLSKIYESESTDNYIIRCNEFLAANRQKPAAQYWRLDKNGFLCAVHYLQNSEESK